MAEQSKYKYIIHVDGNVNAYRLLTTMLTGSLILRVDSPYTSWVDHLIKPNKHYIMVRPDLSDLVEKIQWCMRHDTKSSQIAKNGYDFAKKVLQTDYIKTSIENILWKVSPLPPKPRSPIESPPDSLSWSHPGSPLDSPPTSSSSSTKAVAKAPDKAPETKASKEDIEQVVWSDEEKESKSSSASSSSLEKAKKCPKGYRSQLVTDKSDPDYGKKVCKQKTQKKAVDKGSVIDMPENAKKCPVGYVSFVDKADGKKKCRRKTQKKE